MGNPRPFVFVILITPGDDMSLCRIIVDPDKHAVQLMSYSQDRLKP
jgi:hypothetical protein